tara:strand:+ start:323 stop:1309 length:987 start_codon:yes stop_codon:yes gene_type:complete
MYNITDIRAIHFEITSKCQARCPMCPRRVNGGPMSPGVELHEITLEQFKAWFPVSFIKQLNHFSMCGNLGDPIVAKDTLEIYRYLRETNSNISLQMHTNGSGRDSNWWETLASINVRVVFGIDGLEDTHALYRISTDWNKIISNATAFISKGGDARWDMLVFEHNEHQVETCEQMSKDLGFSMFMKKHTTRFRDGKLNVLDDSGKTTHILYPTEYSKSMMGSVEKAKNETTPVISCKAVKDSQLYVAANGTVTPCCWLDQEWYPANAPSRIDYMEKISTWPNLNITLLEDIFSSGYFNLISSCWNTTGLKECSKQCGSFDKLNEQFIK